MRQYIKVETKPFHGSERIQETFLFLPKTLPEKSTGKMQRRWLEWANICQHFQRFFHEEGKWVDDFWME